MSRSGVIVSITGGICSGKSYIANYLEHLGFLYINLDSVSQSLLQSSYEVRDAILQRFGRSLIIEGKIDTMQLSNRIFNNPEDLLFLNKLMHPIIRREYMAIVQSVNRKRSIVAEIPLLVEEKLREQYLYKSDFYILVTARLQVRLQRALMRNNMTRAKFDAIVGAQLLDSERANHVDFVIFNESRLSALKQVRGVARAMFERNSPRHGDHWAADKRWPQNHRDWLR